MVLYGRCLKKSFCFLFYSFIQRFIFEGELEDHFEEFFIKKDNQFINSFNKQYWNKGFVIRSNETVPQFLKGVAKYILLCGKSMRLLKLCNPDVCGSNYIKFCINFVFIYNIFLRIHCA